MSEIYIVFDGPPGPESGRFVEVEDAHGHSITIGHWERHPSIEEFWVLVVSKEDLAAL